MTATATGEGVVGEGAAGATQGMTVSRLTRRRRSIGRRLRESVTTRPPVTLHTTAPAGAVVAAQAAARAGGERLTVTGVVARAVAAALVRHPDLNAHATDEEVTRFDAVHLGIAVDTPAGLVVPVVHDAQGLDAFELTAAVGVLAAGARDATLRPDQLLDATFTVSSLGALGVEQFTPIINPPQVGVLGVGAIVEVPTWREGTWVPAPVLHLSLTFDHAAIDGAPAARFLADLVGELAQPLPTRSSPGALPASPPPASPPPAPTSEEPS